MTTTQALLVALTMTMASTAHAQTIVTLPVPPPPAGGEAGVRMFVEGVRAPQIDVLGPGVAGDLLFVEPLDGGGPVTGAPYSAEAVTETTQTLADGNRIARRASVQVARDGRGRERREHQAMPIGPAAAERAVTLVTITDPEAGTAVTIDHRRQVATRMTMRRWSGPTGAGTPGTDAMGPVAVAPLRGSVSVAAGASVAAGSAMTWTMAAGPADVVSTAVARDDRQTVALEPQVIEGVRAEGVRTTVTIPAGAIGNERPIEIVHERWYSPELKTVLVSRRDDPRYGETVFRLVGLVRAEPGADLFEIPAGYRIEEPKLPPLPR